MQGQVEWQRACAMHTYFGVRSSALLYRGTNVALVEITEVGICGGLFLIEIYYGIA
jgi:hypothetical protein